MEKFFEARLNELKNLSADDPPLWGKMTAQHMVEHLVFTVRCSNGKMKIECSSPAEKLPVLKRILMSERPLPKNFVNPFIGSGLLQLEFAGLDEAVANIKTEIADYLAFFADNPEAKTVNPTFGELNREEWDVFHKKHFIHHFLQFGITPETTK